MKKLYTIVAALILASNLFAQAPKKMSYQAVIRDNSNQLVTQKAVRMRISILKGSTGPVYVETQNTNTNVNGLVSIEIGSGAVVSGNFSTIDWVNAPYYIRTEIDLTGGNNYTISGTSQLLSVPYALYAENAGTFQNGKNPGDIYYYNGTSWVIIPIGAQGQTLTVCYGVPTWTTDGVCPPNIAIGEDYEGGIVAYILQPGDPGYIQGELHGLIAAPTDQSTGAPWGWVEQIGTSIAIGTGLTNTIAIVNGCGTVGIAARICNDLVLNGYSDWYLPSKDELNKLYLNKNIIGGFTGVYWSSSELEEWGYSALMQSFYNGVQDDYPKDWYFRVRAVRAF